jgi:5-methylcytosine-specific restriction endonuclease McrA
MATDLSPLLNLLATDAKGTKYDHNSLAYMEFVIREASDEDRRALADCLREMKYSRFLKTVYWAIIRARIMALQPNCQRCRVKRTSMIHHRNYHIHGTEHEHIGSLVGLCGGCHQREHDLLPELSQGTREYQASFVVAGANQGNFVHVSEVVRGLVKAFEEKL